MHIYISLPFDKTYARNTDVTMIELSLKQMNGLYLLSIKSLGAVRQRIPNPNKLGNVGYIVLP